jgi:hypothetical protein
MHITGQEETGGENSSQRDATIVQVVNHNDIVNQKEKVKNNYDLPEND